ncbi:hypothetical protein ERO13_D10G172501v2, partial [Gossypium hirsutum]
MSIVLPSPTWHINPSFKAFTALAVLAHVKEGLAHCLCLKTSPSGKYFALKTLKHKVSFCVVSFQTCLPKKAKLNRCIFRKPIP